MRDAALVCLLMLQFCAPGLSRDYVAERVAGTGAPENNGDAGPAVSTNIGEPFGVEIGPDDALYITEVRNHRVRRLDPESGELTTVAGSGQKGAAGDGGPAVEAKLNEPYEVRFDRNGQMYVVEMRNHIVRGVDRQSKTISTIAGTGRSGFGGDGGRATEAAFNQPHSIAIDRKSALYIADIGNHRVRRLDRGSGIVESIAGTGERRMPNDGQAARGNPILGPRALFIDGDTLWIALREGHSVWRMDLVGGRLRHVAGTGEAGFAGDGGPAELAMFNGPKGIAVDRAGNVFVADTENNAVRMIDRRTWLISTIAGGNSTAAVKGAQAEPAAGVRLNRPHGICVARDGTIYVGDTLNHQVVRLK